MTEHEKETIDDLVAGREEQLVAVTRGSTRLLIFNRPDVRNAMSTGVRRAYGDEMAKADADPAIHCVIVTGAHGYFSAGVDIKEWTPGVPPPVIRPNPVEVGRSMSKPIIAMIDGPCVTGALELALACTFLIGSDRSSYSDTHLKIGIFPGWGNISLLASAIGARRAAQMQMLGDRIDARTAYEWGLVNEIVPQAQLLSRCLEMAAQLAKLNAGKRERFVQLNRRVSDMALDSALAEELVVVERMRFES